MKPMSRSLPSRFSAPLTLPLRGPFRDGHGDRRERRSRGREQQLGVAEHPGGPAAELAKGLGAPHGGDGEQPSPAEGARPAQQGSRRRGKSHCDEAERHEGGGHSGGPDGGGKEAESADRASA